MFLVVFLQGDDCDEEDFCAISPNWSYDKQTQQWRRLSSNVDILSLSDPGASQNTSSCDVSDRHDVCSINSSSSTESEGHDGHHKSPSEPVANSTTIPASTTDDQETSRSSSRCSSTNKTLDTSFSGPPSPVEGSSTMSLEAEGCCPDKPPRRKCTTLLRKMEKLRLRRTLHLDHSGGRNSRSLTRHAISGPILVKDVERLNCPSR